MSQSEVPLPLHEHVTSKFEGFLDSIGYALEGITLSLLIEASVSQIFM